jgi:hypothetical protein
MSAGCGGGSPPAAEAEPANTPGATPDSSQNVNCPGSGGPSSGSLTGLGATIGQFRQAHAQDPAHTSDFGGTISGGPNDGLSHFTAFCYASGLVVSVTQNLDSEITAPHARSSIASLGIAPNDSMLTSSKPQATCELDYYTSASIGNDPGANDTAGTFVVELQSPATTAWDPNNVTSLIYDLDTSGGC